MGTFYKGCLQHQQNNDLNITYRLTQSSHINKPSKSCVTAKHFCRHKQQQNNFLLVKKICPDDGECQYYN